MTENRDVHSKQGISPFLFKSGLLSFFLLAFNLSNQIARSIIIFLAQKYSTLLTGWRQQKWAKVNEIEEGRNRTQTSPIILEPHSNKGNTKWGVAMFCIYLKVLQQACNFSSFAPRTTRCKFTLTTLGSPLTSRQASIPALLRVHNTRLFLFMWTYTEKCMLYTVEEKLPHKENKSSELQKGDSF